MIFPNETTKWYARAPQLTLLRVPSGADTRRELKMCINYEDYLKKRNVLHLILLHTITYRAGAALG